MINSKIKTAICVFSITLIVACLVQALPKLGQIQETEKYSVIDTVTGTEAYDEPNTSSGSTEDEMPLSEYMKTEEYTEKNKRIQAVKERIELLNNGLVSDLTDNTRTVFNNITSISADSDNKDSLNDCKLYMTDEFFERFKSMKFHPTSYMVYDIKFSDLDKEDISAYVFTRGSMRFFVTFTFDIEKNYVISNILQIGSEE